jgi:hypothetical protein
MGREIRRVPPDWQHPTELKGYYPDIATPRSHYTPLYDQTYEEALDEHAAEYEKWVADEDGSRSSWEAKHPARHPLISFIKYHGRGPIEESYRPDFTSEPTAYQVYETVTEGTPVSPVLATKEELVEWLTRDHPEGWPDQPEGARLTDLRGGYWWRAMSRAGAEAFAEQAWVPSGFATPEHGYESGLEFIDREANEAHA